MTIAYTWGGHDNDSYMFIDGHPYSCTYCGSRLINTYNPNMKLNKKSFDVSSTYDGYTIVSKRFVDYLMQHKYSGIYIYPLLNSEGFFYFNEYPLGQISFDSPRRKIELTSMCEYCNYTPKYGSTPAFLLGIETPIKKGFYRTDIIFGDPGSEGPLEIVGIETFKEMKEQKFKGMDCNPINHAFEKS